MTPGRGILAFPALVAVSLLLAGCTQTSGPPEPGTIMSSEQIHALADQESDNGHEVQAELLEDGEVTLAEYDASFASLSECLTGKGITISAPLMSPVTGNRYEFAMDFGTRDQASAIADIDSCQGEFWTSVSMAFSLSKPAVMEPPLRQAVADCITDAGVEATGDEANVQDFVNLPGAEEDSVLECARVSAAQLYPEYPSMAVGY